MGKAIERGRMEELRDRYKRGNEREGDRRERDRRGDEIGEGDCE